MDPISQANTLRVERAYSLIRAGALVVLSEIEICSIMHRGLADV
jgi:hypothetical protein